MELTPIFVKNNGEGLYSIRYEVDMPDEFERLFELWSDTEYIANYLKTNADFLQTAYFNNLYFDDLISLIYEEGRNLENLIYEYSNTEDENADKNLQMIFKPLDDMQSNLPVYQDSKALVKDKQFKFPLLRIYAIKISESTFVVTGGAIKLTHKMIDHPDTENENNKLKKCKEFLKANQISCEEDLIYYYEHSE